MIIVDRTKYRNIIIYAACTESLKHGINHGAWLDTTLEVEDMKMEIAAMLLASLFAGKTKWCITYIESPWHFRFLNTHTTLEQLHKMACFIEYFNEGDFGAQLLDRYCGDVDEANDVLGTAYLGAFDSVSDFIKKYLRWNTKTPKSVIETINTKKLWKLWRQDKFFVIPTHPHGVQMFRKTSKPVVLD